MVHLVRAVLFLAAPTVGQESVRIMMFGGLHSLEANSGTVRYNTPFPLRNISQFIFELSIRRFVAYSTHHETLLNNINSIKSCHNIIL